MPAEKGGRSSLWTPKPLRPQAEADLQACIELLHALREKASHSTYMTFKSLAETPPTQRLDEAIRFVLSVICQAPAARDIMSQALSFEEFQSHLEVANLGFRQEDKHTVARLLCINERHATLCFFRGAYQAAAQQQPIHPFDLLEE